MLRRRASIRTRTPYSGTAAPSGQATTVVTPNGAASSRTSTVVPKAPVRGSALTVPVHCCGPEASRRAALSPAYSPWPRATTNASVQTSTTGLSMRGSASAAAVANSTDPTHAAIVTAGRPSTQHRSAASAPRRDAIHAPRATQSTGEIDGRSADPAVRDLADGRSPDTNT